ncbi:chemotaxis protein CheW [Limnobacter sp.]|uniref:chemotaxis protein CheW n=1 Tax=Limnobacter sp. TaxID=2003368 RepID=UPI002FE3B730
MAIRKYRGIEMDSAHIDMAKNLDSVHDLIDELRDLQSTWNNLSLLGELTQVGTEIADTRQHFQQLASDLTNFLVKQSTRQTVELLASRAQNSIDILVRNLYERTADIGFLVTDSAFTGHCIDAQHSSLSEEASGHIRQRMKNYTSNYSVYENVILLDQHGDVIVDMLGELAPGEDLKWIKHKVAASAQYAEAFRPLRMNDKSDELIYAWKMTVSGQTKGYIALVFNLEEESKALFSKVIGPRLPDTPPEWRVCGVSDAAGKVLISSNSQYVGQGQIITLSDQAEWGITQIGPVAYLCCIRPTRGYQGYSGPGWKGFCLVPLSHAFGQQHAGEEGGLSEIDPNAGLIDARIQDFQSQAAQIQRQLNRSIWNGNIAQRNSNSALGNSFGKTLLWEISRAGERTKTLFSDSLNNLVNTEINGYQNEQQIHAMLAMDLMDRNLYERANDCRWWALNPTLKEALLNAENPETRLNAANCLKHIHSLYTVYTNIFLLDRNGCVICDSASEVEPGKHIEAGWIHNVMQLKNQSQYCVSKFEKTDLYQDRPTYIYSAAVFENADNPSQCIGAIALVFDSEPQFEAILNESMGESKHKAFAFIVDEKQQIISSTTDQFTENGKFTLPWKQNRKFVKQATDLGYFNIAGKLLAYGLCNSGSYREFKSDSDTYQNNLICLYGLEIGTLKQENKQSEEISFEEFRHAGQKEQTVDIAAFRVGRHWYGIDSEDAEEAFLCNQIVSLPNSPDWILGNTLHRKQAITIVDVSEFLSSSGSEPDTGQRQQMILLRTGGNNAKVALAVDELGEIPSLPMSAIHESDRLQEQGGIVQGLIKTSNNVLVLLNSEHLLRQLETGIKKAPRMNKGLSSETIGR